MMRRKRLNSWLTGLLVSAAVVSSAMAHSLKDVEDMLGDGEFYLQIVNRAAPDFTLQDTTGRPVRLADFRGKVVVLYFIYASCPDICPLHSDRIAALQQQINSTPMRDIVQFITITTDPARDTPEVLKDYGPSHALDPINWLFLTSGPDKPAATRELAEAYGLKFTPHEGGYQMHGVVTHVIDKSGTMRARFHGLGFHDTNFIVYVNALTNDTH